MTFYSTSNRIGVSLGEMLPVAGGKKQVPIGTIVPGIDTNAINVEGEYIYAFNLAPVARGQCIYLDVFNGSALAESGLHANDGGPIAFAIQDMPATMLGWFQVSGTVFAKCAAGVVANSKVFISAVPGEVDDAPLPGCQILGAEFEAAEAAILPGFVMLTCNRPHLQGQIT